MSKVLLSSNAELKAEKAESLKTFSGLKLFHVKNQVANILGLIGRNEIFDQYTKHDITHIDSMLESLDWIIPKTTQEIMTQADWMMMTLSIYFHDLGMLVTKDEYSDRDNNEEFNKYKNDVLTGKLDADFQDKVLKMQPDEQNRFLYQEYVRRTHAERIRYWINGEKPSYQKNELAVAIKIKELLKPLSQKFKKDLALVCESHHLYDLDNFDKYKVSYPYGPSDEEKVNVQYAALILRTADLMHITSDRTPSIEFYLINPSDPKSQEEWSKQSAVANVRPQIKKDKDGNLNDLLSKDTFEITATFEEDSGYFALIAYVNFAIKELKQNFDFNQKARLKEASKYEYPWNNIDDKNIETTNFEKQPLQFVLDQTKILDLLVGHTLYNDSTVVLRELSQNAIDAVRLQEYSYKLSGETCSYIPEVKIEWNKSDKILSFIDNGTGMTREIIEQHLLKVGSSRYQDENFKKDFPNFSPISRFGIGLLTCFLIADDLDIITKSNTSDKAIILRIKKVHGKYLIKYLSADEINPLTKPHGTEVRLQVRSGVNLENIERELKKWILIPNCKFTLLNSGTQINIGSNNLSELLSEHLKNMGYVLDQKNIRVEEVAMDGVSMVFALEYSEHFKEWSFLKFRKRSKEDISPVGTCIEGIRVDFNTPGFIGNHIFSIVNASGRNSPKTNVARSTIEMTPERENLILTIYQLYLKHISEELKNLHTKKGFSLSWATYEANYIIDNFFAPREIYHESGEEVPVRMEDKTILQKAISDVSCLLFEQKQNRVTKSINEIMSTGNFWTIDCALYDSADSLIKEIPESNASALSILKTLINRNEAETKHIDNLFCNISSGNIIENIITSNFQVNGIKIIPEQRRVDLRWVLSKEKIWDIIDLDNERIYDKKCFIQIQDIDLGEITDQIAIRSRRGFFILKNSLLNKYLISLSNKFRDKAPEEKWIVSSVVGLLNGFFYRKTAIDKTKIEEYIELRLETRYDHRNISKTIWGYIDKEELVSTILKTNFIKYDTTLWHRGGI